MKNKEKPLDQTKRFSQIARESNGKNLVQHNALSDHWRGGGSHIHETEFQKFSVIMEYENPISLCGWQWLQELMDVSSIITVLT